MNLEAIIKQEIDDLRLGLDNQISDPVERAAVAQMASDLAMIPIWMSRGEDMSLLLLNIKAEAALRGVSFSLKSQNAVKQAWMNVLTKVLSAAITGALV